MLRLTVILVLLQSADSLIYQYWHSSQGTYSRSSILLLVLLVLVYDVVGT
jgi:hypothetical protein